MKLSLLTFFATTVGVATAQSGTEPFAADFSPIVDRGNYTALLLALSEAGSDTFISENVPVTIFGPIDNVFYNYSDLLDGSTPEEIQSILLNHVIVGANVTTDVLKEEGCIEATTAGGLEISVLRDPFTGEVDIDGYVLVVDPDITGDYGVLHGIDQVIFKEGHEFLPCPGPVDFSPIAQAGNYSTLLSSIEFAKTDFAITVNGLFERNTTIFGPSDAAFAASQDAVAGFNPDQLDEVLLGHMAYFEFFSDEVVAFGCVDLESLAGTPLAVRFNQTSGTASVNGIPISNTAFDIAGEGYVFHGIEGVLVGSEYVPCSEDPLDLSRVVEAGKYSTLLGLVGQTGLDADISLYRPVTIIAPTDAAFARVADTVSGLSDPELAAELSNHIIANITVDSAWVAAAECIDFYTFGDLRVAIRIDAATGQATVNGIPVVETDITGNFGILHGIDGVLGIDGEFAPCNPYSEIEFLSSIYEEEIIAAAIAAQAFAATVFAPTDDALFAVDGYPFAFEEELDFLLGHIVPGVYTAEQVKEAGCVVLDTLAGTKVRVMWTEDASDMGMRRLAGHLGDEKMGMVMVNDAKVILADQLDAETGSMLHGIDKAILEGSFSECPPKPTMAPVAPPTADVTSAPAPAPAAPPAESSAFVNGFRGVVIATMVALGAL